jgi:hypothetical protein
METTTTPLIDENAVYSNKEFRNALRVLGITPTASTPDERLAQVANALGIVPRRRNSIGEYTNTLLKFGSPLWRRTIINTTMAIYKQQVPQTEKPKTELKTKSVGKNTRNVPVVAEKLLLKQIGKFQKYYIRADGINNLLNLYDVIKQEEYIMGGISYVSLILINEDSNEVRMISINSNYLNTYEDFIGRIDQIRDGKLEGSDSIGEEWNLILNEFHISSLPIQLVRGKSDSIVWKCEGIESKKNICGYDCLIKLGFEYDADPKLLRSYAGLLSYIQKNKLRVNIIANCFGLRRPAPEIMAKNGTERIMITHKKREELRIITHLTNEDVGYTKMYECNIRDRVIDKTLTEEEYDLIKDETNFPTIIYDEINSHFDIAVLENGTPALREDIAISASSEVMRGSRILFTAKQNNINAQVKVRTEFHYIFFDYETIIDFKQSSCMKPYSLSVLWLGELDIIELERADKENNGSVVDEFRKGQCKTFLGYDCNEKFINWFLKGGIDDKGDPIPAFSNDKTCCFVGFNNACFDNFILLDALLSFNQYENKVDFSVKNIFYNGSQLLNFDFDGRHTLFDIRKHLVGSLANNCKSFKINCCAKKSFNHALAQTLHHNDGLLDYINGNEELREYNEYDVLATAVLFQRYRDALKTIPSTAKYGEKLKDNITIGSLIYSVFKDHQKTLTEGNKPLFGKMSYQYYKDLQKYKIAGRVELFNGIQEITERMCSTDVCSLYPFVMSVLNVYYPCGDIVEVADYQGDDEIGFYYCDIDQSNLSALNLPKIYARKTEIENDWGHEEVLENYLISNVMIGLLRKNGCSVVVKNGFIFSRKLKSCEMFSFILEMMKAKNEQDTLKKNKDPAYNPALRETEKLLMNSLSGKVIEGLHTEKTTDLANMYEYEKIQEKATAINFINAIGDKLFITYEVDAEELCETQQRPIFLGVLIYDYAKRYMYDMSYSKIGKDALVYTDTDASKFRYSSLAKWEEWIQRENVKVPCWEEAVIADPRYATHLIYDRHSKVFGSFEDELEDFIGDKYRFYCVEKKSWSYEAFDSAGDYAIDGDGDKCVKFKFKGINGKAIIATMREDFIATKYVRQKDGSYDSKRHFQPETEQQVYQYCEDNKHLAIENGNIGMFFNKLFTKGEAFVICNSFRKIVKNASRSCEFGDEEKYNALFNKIQVNYCLKHIKLKNKAIIRYDVGTEEA